jgi:hypothetical protein
VLLLKEGTGGGAWAAAAEKLSNQTKPIRASRAVDTSVKGLTVGAFQKFLIRAGVATDAAKLWPRGRLEL